MKKPSNSYTFGLIPFSKLFICGKWKWKQNSTKLNYTPVGLFVETSPTLHLSLYPCLLQCDSETPSVRKWSQFFHFYIWAGHGIFFLFALHIEWSENDVPSEELVQFSWTLLEHYPRNVIKSMWAIQRTRGHMDRSLPIPAKGMIHQPAGSWAP